LSRCTAIKLNGERCKGRAIEGSEWCYNHSPAHAAERRRHGARGGKRAGRGRPLVAASDVADQVQDLADKVLAGELDRADATTCGQLLNVKLRALEVGRKLREAEDLERRMEELETLVAARKERPWGA
jgi:hypothetical protein